MRLFMVTNIGDEDPFPFEFRPNFELESLKIRIPIWMDYVLESTYLTYQYRVNNDLSSIILEEDIPLPDPTITIDGDFYILEFSNENIPCIDLLGKDVSASINYQLLPSCISTSAPSIFSSFYFKKYSYLGNQAKSDSLHTTHYLSAYRFYNLNMQATNPINPGISTNLSWEFQLSLGSNPINYLNKIWLKIHGSNNSTIHPTALKEKKNDGTIIFHDLIPINNSTDFIVLLDTIYKYENRVFELCADYTSCNSDSLLVSLELDCSGYPSDFLNHEPPCLSNLPEMELSFEPQEADLVINLVESPTPPLSLCTENEYVLKVINIGNSLISNPNLVINLADLGINIVPGSSMIEVGSNNYIPIPDPIPIPNSNSYQWDLSLFLTELTGIQQIPDNQFLLSFNIIMDCDIKPNLPLFTYSMNWSDICSNPEGTPIFFTIPSSFEGQPDVVNQYDSQFEPYFVKGCQDSQIYTVTIINMTSPTNTMTSINENVFLILPTDFDYETNSFNNVLNFQNGGDPIINIDGNKKILEWTFPSGVPVGDSIVFEITLLLDEELNCDTIPFKLETVYRANIPCASVNSGFCLIDFVTSSQDFLLEVIKPTYNIEVIQVDAIPENQNSENWIIDLNIENTSSIDATSELSFKVFIDSNDDGILDSMDDYLDNSTANINFLEAGQNILTSINFSVPSNLTCHGIFLVLDTTQCICSSIEFYIEPISLNNIASSISLCSGEPFEINTIEQVGYSYEWIIGAEHLSNGNSAQPIFQQEIPEGTTDTTLLILETIHTDGCVTQDSTYVIIYNPDVNIEPIQNNLCHDDSIASIQAVSTDAISYVWENGDNTSFRNNLPAGIYYVTISDGLCQDSSSIVIINPNDIIVDAIINLVTCPEGTDGMIELIIEGGTLPYTFDWSNGNDNQISSNLNSGEYIVTITDAQGCSKVDFFELLEPLSFEIIYESQSPSCETSNDGWIEINMIGTDFLFSIDGGAFQDNARFENLTIGEYEIIVQDYSGCEEIVEVTLDSENFLQVIAPPDTSILYGDSLELVPTIFGNPTQYKWFPNNSLSCEFCKITVAKPKKSTLYKIEVKDQNGCLSWDWVHVKVISPIGFPNAFSPNGDGYNDFFTGFGNPDLVDINYLRIFNRWGAMIFSRENFEPNIESLGWDGTFKGQPMNPAVFVFVAEVMYNDGTVEIISGDVTLVK